MANGVRLAWLIDPYEERAWIYREGKEPEKLEGFSGRVLAGEEVLLGLEVSLEKLKR